MSDPKDSPSFFRKMVKFVANPATDWADLTSRPEDVRESEFAKSELKAVVERKRRNDFVRKREFDMLRKVRREGLTSEQLASLGGSSRLDDSEGRMPESTAKAERGVKAKIDEIEQQMVGDNHPAAARRPPGYYDAPTQPAGIVGGAGRTTTPGALASGTATSGRAPFSSALSPEALSARLFPDAGEQPTAPAGFDDAPGVFGAHGAAASRPAPAKSATTAEGSSPHTSFSFNIGNDAGNPFDVEVSEVAHDPDLDEAVIAFANADFELSEESLVGLTKPQGPRADHPDTWLVLFDLYRAIGEPTKFEALAVQYANRFGLSSPQWFSMPALAAEIPPAARVGSAGSSAANAVGWVCPALIDVDAVDRLRARAASMPMPWLFDWSGLQDIYAEASARLCELFREWAHQPLDMRWIACERLLLVLQEAAPTGLRDVDPAYWQLRLETLRLANRPDHFDEAAIDYCVTYEVSPPSWERALCKVKLVHSAVHSHNASTQDGASLVSSSFAVSTQPDDSAASQVSRLQLSGELVGDISELLAAMVTELGVSTVVKIDCTRLIRVDFLAAGDLLNWVLTRRNENRVVEFEEAHRLVASFFGAMGINEHARVKVRTV